MHPIDCAVRGDVEFFKQAPIDDILGARDIGGFTVLDRAVMEYQFECCKEICKRCPELVYHRNRATQATPLHHAAWRGRPEMINLIIGTAAMAGLEEATQGGGGKKMPIKLLRGRNGRRFTPLHNAVAEKRLEAAKLLMEADPDGGSEYELPNEWGETPLLKAMKNHGDPVYAKIRTLIIEKLPSQCMVRAVGKNWTPLHFAASEGYLDAIKDIIQFCPNCIDLVDTENRNFLHIAAQCGHTEVVKHALENTNVPPSVLNSQDSYGNTPLHIAALSGNQNMTSILLYDDRVVKTTVNTNMQKVLDAVNFDYDKERARVFDARDKVDEKELKEQSDFDLVVAALIAAISFTVGITVPGGYISEGPNQGMAILWKKTTIEMFVVSNTLGLVLSLYAVFSHFSTRRLLRKKDIHFQVTVATCCTLGAILAMVLAFMSGSCAVLNNSHGLAKTVIVICSSFYVFTFWAIWRMVWQYK